MAFQKEKTVLLRSAALLACVTGLALAGLGHANGTSYDNGEATSEGRATAPTWGAKLQKHVPRPRQPPAPRLADVDEDGAISRGEAQTYYERLFSFLDGDDDGTIASAEFVQAFVSGGGGADERQALSERLTHLFAILDADGDEDLTVREFMNACDEHYGIIDADGDGQVSVREFRSRAL